MVTDELRRHASPNARLIEPELYARVERLVHASDEASKARREMEEAQQVIDSLVEELGDRLVENSPFILDGHVIVCRKTRQGMDVAITAAAQLVARTSSPAIVPMPHAS